MKVLFLLHSYHKFTQGGAELQVKFITEYLIKNNIEVHYVFLHNEILNEIDNDTHIRTIKKVPLLDKLFGKIIYYNKVSNILNKIKPDIIYHRHLSSFAFPVINYCKNNKCKSFLHLALQSDVEKSFVINKKIVSTIIDTYTKRQIVYKFDNIIAQAEYQDKLLELNFNRKANLILANMHPYPKEPIEKTGAIKILWIANLKEWKQPELFIKLAKELLNEDAIFTMIGRDSNDENSKLLKDKINKVKNLSYIGEQPIEKVNKLLSNSHIFVNTSLYEGFPNTYIQSWMREVPVVSLNVDPDNVIKNNNLGFHSKKFKDMVNDVKKLIQNNKMREELGTNSKKYAFDNHSISNIEKLLNLFNKVNT